MRFWQKATQQPWAITQPALTTILDIAARTNEDPEIVAAKLGRDLNNDYAAIPHEGVLEIPIAGPLFRYANLFTLISGATSYERIAHDIQSALANDDVGAIVLNIDSPGGEVNGCSELAQLIFNARGIKPIIAYASGDCASGAYWIASACDRIVAADTSTLGSIGVVAMVDTQDKDDNTLEFVSSQSPHKRLDLSEDADQLRMQQRVDDLAQVFIERVATHRNVDVATVQKDFGQGGVFIGKQAIQAGLADEVGTFASVLLALANTEDAQKNQDKIKDGLPLHLSQTTSSHSSTTHIQSQESPMDIEQLTQEHPALCQQLVDKGEAKATARIREILSCDLTSAQFPLAQHLALNTTLAVDVVKTTLAVVPEPTAPAADAQALGTEQTQPTTPVAAPSAHTDFAAAMNTLGNPVIVPAGDDAESGDTEEALAKRIAECTT